MQIPPEMQQQVAALTQQVPGATIEDAMTALQVSQGFSDADPVAVLQNLISQRSGDGMADHAVAGMGNPPGAEQFTFERLKALMAEGEYEGRRQPPTPEMTPELAAAIGDVNLTPDLGTMDPADVPEQGKSAASYSLRPLSHAGIGISDPAGVPEQGQSVLEWLHSLGEGAPMHTTGALDQLSTESTPKTPDEADYFPEEDPFVPSRKIAPVRTPQRAPLEDPYDTPGGFDFTPVPEEEEPEMSGRRAADDATINRLRGMDTEAGAGASEYPKSDDPDVEDDYDGPFAGMRSKLTNFLGLDADGADNLGHALMMGGGALAAGPANFGTAVGEAFQTGASAYHDSKADKRRDAEMGLREDAQRMAQQLAQEQLEQRRREFGVNSSLKARELANQRSDLEAAGWILDENGNKIDFDQSRVIGPVTKKDRYEGLFTETQEGQLRMIEMLADGDPVKYDQLVRTLFLKGEPIYGEEGY